MNKLLGSFFSSQATVQAGARLAGVLLYGVLLQNLAPEVSVALLIATLVANGVTHRWYVKAVRAYPQDNFGVGSP